MLSFIALGYIIYDWTESYLAYVFIIMWYMAITMFMIIGSLIVSVQKSKSQSVPYKDDVIISQSDYMFLSNNLFCLSPYLITFSLSI